MARMMWEEETEAFRAKITTIIKRTGSDVLYEVTQYAGPFSKKGQASAAITRVRNNETRALWRQRSYRLEPTIEDVLVLGEVQSTGLTWTAVE